MKTIAIFFVLFFYTLGGFSQQIIISGIIRDTGKKGPLAGVTILIKGTKFGTISGMDGKYTISCPDSSAVIIFSYVGFKTKEIVVTNKKVINVALEEDVQSLECVEITAKGQSISKSTQKIQSSELNGVQLTSIDEALQGRIAGLDITSSSGRRRNKSTQGKLIRGPLPGNAQYYNPSNEEYKKINENGFKNTGTNPLSTFSIDVDKASYSNIRRFINDGQKPPADAVRIEEMINYFDYNYPQPTDEHPFSINTDLADCPWQEGHKIIQIGVQGKKIDATKLPSSNLVFLIDVSGSMGDANKLPLLKSAFSLLINNLREKDKVAIVVYAGAAGCVLPSTNGSNKQKILEAINRLESGGSTAGGAGIALAYEIARKNFIEGGNNRVILATDGDFNVGASSDGDMEDLITRERKSDIFLTCLGFGMGNYKDSKLETLADKGNGNFAYIDNLQEANKTLVSEFGGTLFTIAKDVKIQIEFNPAYVQAYRLIGYENRLLNEEDFKDDTKDAGELGADHTVTALYEIIPVGIKSKFVQDIDDLKYQKITKASNENTSTEIATVKMRYKKPTENKSIELQKIIDNNNNKIDIASDNLRFISAVAMYGMILRNSEFKGNSTLNNVIELADQSRGYDKEGYKAEFVRLVKSSLSLANVD